MFGFSKTKLPPNASTIQWMVYPWLRDFLFFFFGFLPYAPIRRENKPNLDGALIWASSHSNYLCDTIPAGFEGPVPTRFFAKSTLFRFPIKKFIEFCGALPVARAEDTKEVGGNRTQQNRSTFKLAVSSIQAGWPIAIFPEGVSIVSSGLVLPLKPGIAKLGFMAEEASDFTLGLRIIPVGLDYGSRVKVGSGLTIRYGQPIYFRDFKAAYLENKDLAVRAVMERLTQEMIHSFPHFSNEKDFFIGKKLVALGLCDEKFEASKLIRKVSENSSAYEKIQSDLKSFEEMNRDYRLPFPSWGYVTRWQRETPGQKLFQVLFTFFGFPFAVVDLLNNGLGEFLIRSLMDLIAVDETEKMSIRFMISPVVLPLLYAAQYFGGLVWLLDLAPLSSLGFASYFGLSLVLWYFGVRWRIIAKKFVGLLLFVVSGLDDDEEVVRAYKGLRNQLNHFKDHGGHRSEGAKN